MSRVLSCLMGAAALTLSNLAFAIDDQSCVEEHARGRELEQKGELLSARDAWKACSNDACPAIVREDCTKLADQTHARIPTLRFRAVLPDGSDAAKVSFEVDGDGKMRELGSEPIALDPGRHEFRFRAAGMVDATQQLNLVTGENDRVVVIRFRSSRRRAPVTKPRAITPEREKPAAIPALGWVFGGVAVASLGVGTYFGLRGRGKESDLDDCAPGCTKSGYDDMHRDYVVADVSFVIAGVATGAALFFVLNRPSSGSSRGKGRGATLAFSSGFLP
jgi:hypothetical protein